MVNTSPPRMTVWCAQIGARDHYAFPRAFQCAGVLGGMVTEYWHGNPPCLPAWLSPRAAGRTHPDLARAAVASANARTLMRQVSLRLRRASSWERVLTMNIGFQKDAMRLLDSLIRDDHSPIALFSYSYAARDLFRMAKDRGWKTVLGQIDPGPEEGRLAEELRNRHARWQCTRVAPPPGYYDGWREETELADRVIVNSEWTAAALRREGVDAAKLVQIGIPYEHDFPAKPKSVPADGFSAARPLRVLFLGQVNLRKGICELLEAMQALRNEPVELTVVGAPQVTVPAELHSLPGLRWIGPLPRGETSAHFRRADVFILPTHSDGFGLTQLEALAHGLPVIVSNNCARLIIDDVHGLVLPDVTATTIADALRTILANPESISRWSSACIIPQACRMDTVAKQLGRMLNFEC